MNRRVERVQKIVANSGFCSRRDAEDLIAQGKVFVNGEKISLGATATPDDRITIGRHTISTSQKKYYFAFHKPKHVLCAATDKSSKKLVLDFFPAEPRLFSVGRLDFHSSGLLFMTNDGEFSQLVSHPRYEVDKTYRVVLDKKLDEKDKEILEKGIELRDGVTTPAKIVISSPKVADVTIHEGKNLIIKRMFKKLNYHVTDLKRIAIGPVKLGRLGHGQYRPLKKHEYEALFAEASGKKKKTMSKKPMAGSTSTAPASGKSITKATRVKRRSVVLDKDMPADHNFEYRATRSSAENKETTTRKKTAKKGKRRLPWRK